MYIFDIFSILTDINNNYDRFQRFGSGNRGRGLVVNDASGEDRAS